MPGNEGIRRAEVKCSGKSVPLGSKGGFCFGGQKSLAYEDTALPIGFDQTISQPSTIAVMLEALGARRGQRVLEAGSGSGYVLALLSRIVGKKGMVFGVELNERLAERSKRSLKGAGAANAKVKFGDANHGWGENAPFDRILVSAACSEIPKDLENQLGERGVLVAPVGREAQRITRLFKQGKRVVISQEKGEFLFVPFKKEG